MTPDPFGLVGQVLDGQIRVDEVAGEGGFSVVYRGYHLGLDETIAVKCLKLPGGMGSALIESFLRRFRDEGKLLYRLSQGNLDIVRSIASGVATASATGALVPYMVLEWLEGTSLAADFERRREAGLAGRSMREVMELFAPVLQAVAHAHAQGVVHRDLNPGNIFLTHRPVGVRAKVLDFGIAKVVSDHAMEMGPRVPTLGQVRVFSPGYAAPEQLDGNHGPIGTSTDVYTLALVMLEALQDAPTARGESIAAMVEETLDPLDRPTPRALGIPVGDAVNAVFARATSLDPASRPQDAELFRASLEDAIRQDSERSDWKTTGPMVSYVPEGEPQTTRETRAENLNLTLMGTGAELGLPMLALSPGCPAPVEPTYGSTLRMNSTPLIPAAGDAPRGTSARRAHEWLSPRPTGSSPPPPPATLPPPSQGRRRVTGSVLVVLSLAVLGLVGFFTTAGVVAVKVYSHGPGGGPARIPPSSVQHTR